MEIIIGLIETWDVLKLWTICKNSDIHAAFNRNMGCIEIDDNWDYSAYTTVV